MSYRALNIAATGATAHKNDLDTRANNIANINTVGYKAEQAFIQDLQYATERRAGGNVDASSDVIVPTSVQYGLGAAVAAVGRDQKQGDPINTGNQTDAMIDGKGYFVVRNGDDGLAFTRDGAFHIDPSTNQLVTSLGYVVSPGIQIPNEYKKILIRQDGVVLAEIPGEDALQEIGQIEVAYFTNPNGLEARGNNLLFQTDASGEAQIGIAGQDNLGTIMSGFLEGSNVDPVQEMIKVMEAQMGYSMNIKVMSTIDKMMEKITTV